MRWRFACGYAALVLFLLACDSPSEPVEPPGPLTGTWKYDAHVENEYGQTMVVDGYLIMEQKDTLFTGSISGTCTHFVADHQVSTHSMDHSLWWGKINGVDLTFVFYEAVLVNWKHEGTMSSHVIEGDVTYDASSFVSTFTSTGTFRAVRAP